MLNEIDLIARRCGIGGSDAAAICGYSSYKTPLDVYLNIIGASENHTSAAMAMGHKMEPVILSMYEDEKNVCLIKNTIDLKKKNQLKFPFMSGNLDAYYFDKDGNLIIVDAKNKYYFTKKEFGEPGTSEMPHDILLQMVHYRILYDAAKVDVAVFFGGADFQIFTYEKNEKLEQFLIKKEKDFWEKNVLAGVPPEPQTLEDVKKTWQFSEPGKTIAATEDMKKLVERLNELKTVRKELEESESDLKLEIQKYIGGCEILCDQNSGEVLATFKSSQRSSLDSKGLKEKHPDIFEQFQKTTNTRTFLIK